MNADEQRAFERLQRTVDKLTAERDEARAQTERMAFKIVEIEDGAKTIRGAYSDACTELSRLRDENARLTKIVDEYADARKWDLEALKSRLQRQEQTERDRDAAIAARDEMARKAYEDVADYIDEAPKTWSAEHIVDGVYALCKNAALAPSRDGKEGA